MHAHPLISPSVTVGDVHGDQAKTISALEVAGVLTVDGERKPLWCGGDTVVVQLGDVLDRGDNEIGTSLITITAMNRVLASVLWDSAQCTNPAVGCVELMLRVS